MNKIAYPYTPKKKSSVLIGRFYICSCFHFDILLKYQHSDINIRHRVLLSLDIKFGYKEMEINDYLVAIAGITTTFV